MYGYRKSATEENVTFSSSQKTGTRIMIDFGNYSVSRYNSSSLRDKVYIIRNNATSRGLYDENDSYIAGNNLVYETEFTCSGTARIFSIGGSPNFTNLFEGYIYYVRIKRNNIDYRYFVPCYRKSDGEIGLLDTVNNVFYTNQGTGEFLKGPDV